MEKSTTGPKKDQKFLDELHKQQTKEFVETSVDEISMNLLKRLYDLAIKTDKKSFTKDSILNDVLNETAQRDEGKTMGGGKFDSSRMNEIIGSNYGDMMNSQSPTISVDGQTPDFLKKDYRELMKAVDKKQGKI